MFFYTILKIKGYRLQFIDNKPNKIIFQKLRNKINFFQFFLCYKES